MKQFFKPVDKGSAKPAFCYPRRSKGLSESYDTMKKTLDNGYVDPARKMAFEQKMKTLKDRIDSINESHANASAIIKKDKDGWTKRRDELAQAISEQTPTRDDVKKRRVNPHSVLRREKQGEKGNLPLEQIKREFTIISRAFTASGDYEEANHSFLQKDK